MHVRITGVIGFLALIAAAAAAQDHGQRFARVQAIFDSKCVTCHSTDEAPVGMSLERGMSYKNIVNVYSKEDPSLKRIDPNNPYGSYLFRKVLRQHESHPYQEEGMPLDGDRLPESEIQAIREWINSFPGELWGQVSTESSGSSTESTGEARMETFLGTQLINLPTTRVLGSRTAEFRILHRFALMNGSGNNTLNSFFGLDNGAFTSINLSLALADRADLLVRRTGASKDVEVAVKYVPFLQQPGLPLSLGFYAGFDWISRADNGANRFSPNVQLLAASRLHDQVSILVVPSFAFRSNHNTTIIRDTTFFRDTRYTFAIGLGVQYTPAQNVGLLVEYIPRLDGYRGNKFSGDRRFNTWSVGLAYKIRLHVFEVVLSNTQLLHTNQYVAGSSSIGKNRPFDRGPNFHFGFNIFRQFKW